MCSDGLRNVQICFFRVTCLAVWDAICLFSCTVTTLVLTSRTTHRLIFLFRQHSTATCLTHASERLPRASAQKMSSAWMFLILWNQYYQTSFPMKHYSPFPCSERLEGKEYRRNCVPTKILHQTITGKNIWLNLSWLITVAWLHFTRGIRLRTTKYLV